MRVLSLLVVLCAATLLSSCDDDSSNSKQDLSYSIRDLSNFAGATTPTCANGSPQCPSGRTFIASQYQSGCFPNGTTVLGSITPPTDTPTGGATCASVGDVSVSCSAGCAFCMKSTAALPPGCTQQ
jgi:hypothetical protein